MSRSASTRIAFALLSISFTLVAGADDTKPVTDKKLIDTAKPTVVDKKSATEKSEAAG